MTFRKTSNKIHNKKLRRRREGLSGKAFEYGEFEGVELALFIRYTKRGDFYAYTSKEQLSWLQDVNKMIMSPKTKREFPEDVKRRVEKTRGKFKESKEEKSHHKDSSPVIRCASRFATRPVSAFPSLPPFHLAMMNDRAHGAFKTYP